MYQDFDDFSAEITQKLSMEYLEKNGKMNQKAIQDTGCPMKFGIKTIEQLVNNSLDWK